MLKRLGLSRNILGALLVLAAFVVWMATGLVGSKEAATNQTAGDAATTEESLPSVAITKLTPENYVRYLKLPAQTAARFRAQIAPQTSGRIAEIMVENGTPVHKGQTLARIAAAQRRIELASAQASLAAARKLAQSARTLAKDGYMSQTTLAEREAAEAEAAARVESMTQDLAYTTITAPIDGVVENRSVSVGDVAAVGTPIMDVVNRKDLLLTAQIPQKERNLVAVGQMVSATLITGEEITGKVDFMATNANAQSRTYEVQMAVDGVKYPLPTGMSAEVNIPTPAKIAYKVPHSAAVLAADGRLGVMQVVNGMARFTVLDVLEDTPAHLWAAGLPTGGVSIITRGQLSVTDGTKVTAE